MRWPALKRLHVANGSIVISYNFARRHQCGLLPRFAVAAAQDAVAQVHREATRIIGIRRMHVDQLRGEIGIHAGRRDVQLHDDRPDHRDIFLERWRFEHEHIAARRERQPGMTHAKESLVLDLVERAAIKYRRAGSQRATHRRHRIGRIVVVLARQRASPQVWRDRVCHLHADKN